MIDMTSRHKRGNLLTFQPSLDGLVGMLVPVVHDEALVRCSIKPPRFDECSHKVGSITFKSTCSGYLSIGPLPHIPSWSPGGGEVPEQFQVANRRRAATGEFVRQTVCFGMVSGAPFHADASAMMMDVRAYDARQCQQKNTIPLLPIFPP